MLGSWISDSEKGYHPYVIQVIPKAKVGFTNFLVGIDWDGSFPRRECENVSWRGIVPQTLSVLSRRKLELAT
jgi:hypothetical protein